MHTEETTHHAHKGGEGHHDSHASHAEAKKSDTIRINKRILAAVLFFGIVVGLAYLGRASVLAVTVNGSPITRFEVMHALERSSGRAYVETLITEKLIASEAAKAGIVITDADVTKEIAYINVGLAAQGATMEMLLSSQGLTEEGLRKQIVIKQTLEKLLAAKIAVSDAEIDAYIAQAKITIDSAKRDEARASIMEQQRGQKLNKEAGPYIEALRAAANVQFFGSYVAPLAAAAK